MGMGEGLLGDLVVLELAEGVAGPYCGKLLAGLGAEVIKVQPPPADPVRNALPEFLHLNTAKKSITLDATTEAGVALLHRLAEQADLVIGERPWPTLTREDLIQVAVSWYGQTGPYRDYRASEFTAFAMSGFAHLTGNSDREPLRPNFNLAQYQGGLHAATGAMAALMYRDATGLGQLVDVAIVEAACFAHGAMAPYLNLGVVYRRAGTRNLNFNPKYQYPSVTLPCKDGHVHVHFAPSDPQLLALLMEEPRLAGPDLWSEPMGHADEFDELCLPWLARHNRKEVVERAQELRHPFTEVLNVAELFQDQQLIARGMLVELDHPGVGRVAHVGPPVRPQAAPWRMARAPLPGEHNEELYCDRLGLSGEELGRLREQHVL